MGRDVDHDTDQLLRQVRQGNERAKDRCWTDTATGFVRWSACDWTGGWLLRVDPSDVVQETLRVANRRLDEYLAGAEAAVLPVAAWHRAGAADRHAPPARAQAKTVGIARAAVATAAQRRIGG